MANETTCKNCKKPIEVCDVRSFHLGRTVYVHSEDHLATCFFENFKVIPNTFATPDRKINQK